MFPSATRAATAPAALAVGAMLALGFSGCGAPDRPPSAEAAARTGPRSIVLVVFDTTRADRLEPYGATRATPTAAALAREGAVFDAARTPIPVTLPAHASLMTGRLPHRHGVRDNGLHRVPDDLPTLAEGLHAAGYATAAVVSAAVLDRQFGLDRGFDRYDDEVAGGSNGLAIAERAAAATTDAALARLAELPAPYFLFVHYFDPHADYRPPPRFVADGRSPYEGEIAYADAELGRLLQAVAARPDGARAVIALTADHGEALGEHGEATHGVFLYDATLRVPWIVRATGRIAPGTRVDAPVALTDVAPTLLELAESGAGPLAPDLDGRSRLPELRDAAGAGTGEFALPLESDFGFNAYGFAPLRGLTDGRWKWIHAPRPELYDLVADPGERRNLLTGSGGDTNAATIADRLRDAWRAATADERTAPPPGDVQDPEQAERLARIAGLGYVSASRRPAAAGRDLPDPKDGIETLAGINRARALLSAGRPGPAAQQLEDIVASTPGSLSALMLLGSAHLEAGDPAAALAPLRRAAALAPHLVDAQFNLGLASLGAGDAPGAEAAWRRAVRVGPRHLPSAANLVDLLRNAGRLDEAAAALRDARANGLDDPVLDYLEGKVAQQRGQRAEAVEALGRALRRGGLPAAAAQDARASLEFLRR